MEIIFFCYLKANLKIMADTNVKYDTKKFRFRTKVLKINLICWLRILFFINLRRNQGTKIHRLGLYMNKICFSILCCIFCIAQIQAQNIFFNHLTPEEGLSQISVNSLYPDEDGEIWVATRVGLNCYNGNSITVYLHQINNQKSLFCNNIKYLTGNGKGKLFLLCSEGLAEMDLRTRQFTTLKYGNIGAICYFDRLLYSQGNQVIACRQDNRHERRYALLPRGEQISRLFVDSHKRLWMGTVSGGLYCQMGKKLTHPVVHSNITSIYEDREHEIWVGSWNDGLYKISTNGKIKNIRQGKWLNSNFVRTFCEDDQGSMWIGTFHGLLNYNKKNGKTHLFTARNFPGSLSNQSIWSIVKDHQGTLWIGTYFGGVNYVNPEYEIYSRYQAAETEREGLSSNIVGRMTEDDSGNLWICTEGGGLNIYNRTRQQFKWYRYPGSIVSQNNLKAIYYDRKRHIMWIGTHLGGLDRIDMVTGQVKVYRHQAGNPSSLPMDIVRDIIGFNKYIILGTQKGVAILDPDTHLFHLLMAREKITQVSSICMDRTKRLWIATEGQGVYTFNLLTRATRHYICKEYSLHSISSNSLNNVMVDARGRIWLSTSSNGIDLYRPKSDNFENFGQSNGLASNCVYAVAQSSLSKDRLLLITNQGFSELDIREKHFRNYGHTNGFPLATVNENALYVAHDGTIFLGGVKGMISFSEKSLHQKTKPYTLNFSRLYVNGTEVTPGDGTGILSQCLQYERQISLSHKQSMFVIEYSSSNYIDANNDELYYRLMGHQDEWTHLPEGQKTLVFAGLSAGNYTLQLRSARRDIPMAELNIAILPPWYLSLWADIIYALLIAAAIWWLFKNYRSRIRLNESLKYEKQHTRDIEEMNQSKLRFFTNVSHEIRTPLTVIIGLSESLLRSDHFVPAVFNKIMGIYKSSSQLRELISELLDFRKQEQGHMQIKVSEQDFPNFVQESYFFFKEYASNLGIKLLLKQKEPFNLWFDTKQMQKVINNLVSNALKNTPQGGMVTLEISHDESHACLSVSDTGKGIGEKEKYRIFDRFYQTEHLETINNAPGTGIGLSLTKGIVELHHGTIDVKSQLGKGTTFIVILPLGNEMYRSEEIDHNRDQARQVVESPAEIPEPSLKDEEQEKEPFTESEEKPLILIVEDNDSIRDLLENLFRPYYRVLTAVDGLDAIKTVRDEMPDIVLSDIVMPNISGTELCKTIKQDFSICHIPVVLLTAHTDIEYNIEGLKIGADDYITKPFNSDILISRCNNLINTRRLLQRKFSEHPHAHADILATNPLDQKMMDKAMKIIDAHYNNPDFNVDIFAREIGMSRTALFTKWKQLTGQTPKNFILNIRLRKCAVMLRSNAEMSIAEISDSNGFSSAKYFCKCFKDHFKMQPSAYRKCGAPHSEDFQQSESTDDSPIKDL